MSAEGIVADGRRRVRSTDEYKRRKQEIELAVEERYRARLEQAGPLRRLILKARMGAEVAREIGKLAPGVGNYLRG
jgi:hypothetical protein